MDDISKQIDVIVREVVRRLRRDDSLPAESNQSFVSDRVVTLAQIENRLDGANEIVVAANAVVTPSVFDLLREKSIRLVRRSKLESGENGRHLLVAVGDDQLTVSNVTRRLEPLNRPIDVFVEANETRLLERIGKESELADNSVVITSRPYRFGCVANRNEKIRAIVAHDERSAVRAKEEASANVLILDTTTICPKIIRSFLQ